MKYPNHLKAQNRNKPEVEVNLKENLMNKDRTHLKPKRQMKLIHMKILTLIITTITLMPPSQSRGRRPFIGQGGNQQFRDFTQ